MDKMRPLVLKKRAQQNVWTTSYFRNENWFSDYSSEKGFPITFQSSSEHDF